MSLLADVLTPALLKSYISHIDLPGVLAKTEENHGDRYQLVL